MTTRQGIGRSSGWNMSSLGKLLLALLLTVQPAWAANEHDGTDDCVRLTAESNFGSESGPITLACWIYPDTITAGDRTSVFSKDGGAGFFRFDASNTGGTQCSQCIETFIDYSTTDLNTDSATNDVPFDTWTHVAFVWDGGTTAGTNTKLYINGVEPTYSQTQNAVGTRNTDSTAVWGLGGRDATCDNRPLDGFLTECAMWSSALSAEEVAHLASSRVKQIPLQVSPSTLLAYYPLDEVSTGASGDAVTFKNLQGNTSRDGTGVDGANNTGLTGAGEAILSYP